MSDAERSAAFLSLILAFIFTVEIFGSDRSVWGLLGVIGTVALWIAIGSLFLRRIDNVIDRTE